MKQAHAASCKLEGKPQNCCFYYMQEPCCFSEQSPNKSSFHLFYPVLLFPETTAQSSQSVHLQPIKHAKMTGIL